MNIYDRKMTQIEAKTIANLFKRYDHNGDHKLQAGELYRLIGDLGIALSADEFTTLFEQFDADENGCLDLDEFVHFVYVALNCDFSSTPSMLFYIFDRDHSKSIDRRELGRMMRMMGYQLASSEIDAILAYSGAQNRLNYEQFCEFVRTTSE